jgi:hypothetical protein
MQYYTIMAAEKFGSMPDGVFETYKRQNNIPQAAQMRLDVSTSPFPELYALIKITWTWET